MNLNELAKEAHQNAVDHGFWDPEPTFGELVALMHSELSEALEEYRAGRPMVLKACMTAETDTPCLEEGCEDWNEGKCELTCLSPKPEGITVELADCIIRILDWCGHKDMKPDGILLNIHEPYKDEPEHEGPFGDFVSMMHNLLSAAAYDSFDDYDRAIFLCSVIYFILDRMEREGVDMESIIREKMDYNRTRPYRHGGKKL